MKTRPLASNATPSRRRAWRAPTRLLALAVLCGSVGSAPRAHAAEVRTVIAELVSLERKPACGILSVGSLATFRLAEGPAGAPPVRALVHCAEMHPELVVGRRFTLRLSKENVHRIGTPDRLPDAEASYLVEALPVQQAR
jgi:hypothetical protein